MYNNSKKTNKHQMLLFVERNEKIRARDVVNQFDYSPGTARSYLSYLTRQGLLECTPLGHILSEKGRTRLGYFEAMGCSGLDCPLCKDMKAGHYTCTRCGYELPKGKAMILPEWDFILGVRHSGVYCPLCKKQIFTEKQALLIGIHKEES